MPRFLHQKVLVPNTIMFLWIGDLTFHGGPAFVGSTFSPGLITESVLSSDSAASLPSANLILFTPCGKLSHVENSRGSYPSFFASELNSNSEVSSFGSNADEEIIVSDEEEL